VATTTTHVCDFLDGCLFNLIANQKFKEVASVHDSYDECADIKKGDNCTQSEAKERAKEKGSGRGQ